MDNQIDDVDLVRQWLEENERSLAWLARQIDWTRAQLSNVLNRKRPMSRRLARDISAVLGISLQGVEHGNTKVDDESELLGTVAQLVGV